MPDAETAGATPGTGNEAAQDVLWEQAMGPDGDEGADDTPAAPGPRKQTQPSARGPFIVDEVLGDSGDEQDADEDPGDGAEGEDEVPKSPQGADEDPVVFTIEEPDGTTREIRKSEARAGHLRHADYTRKTMAVAEIRKQVEAQRDAYAGVTQAYLQHLQAIRVPDFEKIRADHGNEAYLLAKAEWQEVEAERNAAAQELQRVQVEQQAAFGQQMQEQMEEAARQLPVLIPSWTDGKTAERESAAIRRFLAAQGFAPQEIAQVRDPRHVVVLRKAALYDQMQSKAKGKVRPAKGTLRPGTTVATNMQQARAVKTARQKLRETGDAGDYLDALGLLDF